MKNKYSRLSVVFRLFVWCLAIQFLGLAAEVEITLLQTTDSHSSLTKMERKKEKSTFLQLATLIRRELSEDEDALLIDCGDCVQGSVSSSLSEGMAGLEPILALPYDVWVPGNHELDFGIEAYLRYCQAAGDKLLCGNLFVKGHEKPRAWRIFERKGARIAVIGMEASFFKNWLLAQDYARLESRKAVDVLEEILPEVVAAKPDAIVLATHQAWFEGKDTRGVNEVNDIAKRFPEIDVILGGHSHRVIPGVRIGLKSWYVQAGALAQHLGVVKMSLDTEAHKVLSISSSIKVVNEDTPEDAQLKKTLAARIESTRAALKAETGIVLNAGISHEGKPGNGCQTSALLAAAMSEASGADVAFHGKLYDISLNAGRVKMETFYWLVPYENRIVTFDATSEQLEQLMAEQWKQRNSYRYNGPWNMEIEIDGEHVKLLSIAGEKPNPGKKWRVSVNSHAAAGSGAFPLLQSLVENPASHTVVSKITTRTAVINYLKAHQSNLNLRSTWISKASK